MGTVKHWLNGVEGVDYTAHGATDIRVTATIDAASTLLCTTFQAMTHVEANTTLVRAKDYELPGEVHAVVTTIFGLHGIPLPLRRFSQPPKPPPVAVNITQAVIRTAYGVPDNERGHNQTRQAVAEFQGQFMNSTDLAAFFKQFVKTNYSAGTEDVVSRFVGPHYENSHGIEAELDIQYLMGVAPGVATEFWEFPAQDFGSDLNAWTTQLLTTDDPPLVWSVSYGWQGNLSDVHMKVIL
jgi:tripeptidyl-peptidase-1